MAKVTGTGQAGMRTLAAALKEASPMLRRELRGQFRDIAGPLADAARQAIRDSPSKHDGTLRAEIAATVSSGVTISDSGVRLAVTSRGSRMPPGKERLPSLMNDDRRFHHPVFGRPIAEIEASLSGRGRGRGWTWVAQESHARGWFDGTLSAREPDARRAVEAAMDAVRRRLEL